MDAAGVTPPLGVFDPLGLLDDTAGFARRRAVEIKHGRIAMVAFLGMLVQELGVTFPGTIDLAGKVPFSEIGTGFTAVSNIPLLGVAQIMLFCTFAELYAIPASQYAGGRNGTPGGYERVAPFIPAEGYPWNIWSGESDLGISPDESLQKRNMELNNGRAAMLGVFGAMCHANLESCDYHMFYPITHN